MGWLPDILLIEYEKGVVNEYYKQQRRAYGHGVQMKPAVSQWSVFALCVQC